MAPTTKKKSVKENPAEEKRLQQLIDLLEKLSIEVKYDRGFFRGGLVRYRDRLILYLNRKAETQSKIDLILEELKLIHIPEKYLTDDLKRILNKQQTLETQV